jgi:hypothetical protein
MFVDRPVAQRLGERVVHETVLVEEREVVEARARHDHLEVIASAVRSSTRTSAASGIAPRSNGLETLDSHARPSYCGAAV